MAPAALSRPLDHHPAGRADTQHDPGSRLSAAAKPDPDPQQATVHKHHVVGSRQACGLDRLAAHGDVYRYSACEPLSLFAGYRARVDRIDLVAKSGAGM